MPHLQLLRTPSLTLADGGVHPLERKDAALLAMLATDGPSAPAQAAGLLWPDTEPAQARANLRQRLHRLRKLAGGDVVISAKDRLALVDATTVDVRQFDEALTADPQAGNGDLLGALDFGDLDELQAWVDTARQRWRRHRFERLARRASALEAGNEIAAALVLAQRTVADDPLHEHSHRRLMRLHYLRGDRAAALAAYQQCRLVLRAQLGTAPDRETAALAALIESGDVLQQPAPAPTPPLIATLRPPRLCGRSVQWRLLEAAHAAGRALLVEGEAGIGKTRLLGDFAAATGDAPVFGARPGDAALPYALLARLVHGLGTKFADAQQPDWVLPELARIAPELGVPATGQLSPLRLQQAALQALATWQAAGLRLLVVDDLHHADAATLDLLPALATGSGERGLVWLMGVRQMEVPLPIQAWLDSDAAAVPERVLLGPLDLAATQSLLESLALPDMDAAQWAPHLLRHIGGNPLFLLETLMAALRGRTGAATLGLPDSAAGLPAPQRIGRLIERRLELLTPAALKLARLAAIAGQDFSVALAAQVLGQHALDIADSWRELEAAHVISGGAFAHDLILEGTLRSIPDAIARHLHRDVANELQRVHAAPARLAAHWSAAGEWALAGDAFVVASQAAVAASRSLEAAELDAQAVRCFRQAGLFDKAFEALRASVDTALNTRPAEQVVAMTNELLGAASGARQRLQALTCKVRSLFYAGRRPDAIPLADESLALAEILDDPGARFDAACNGAICMSPGPRAGECIKRLQSFGSWVQSAADPKLRYRYYTILFNALREDSQLHAAAEAAAITATVARELGATLAEANGLTNTSMILLQLGQIERGYAITERACKLLFNHGEPDGVVPAVTRICFARYAWQRGQFDSALQAIERAWNNFGRSGGTLHHTVCENDWASLWLHLGQPARALAVLAQVPNDLMIQLPSAFAQRLVVEARIDRLLNRPASDRLIRAIELLATVKNPQSLLPTLIDRSREQTPMEAAQTCEHVRCEALNFEMTAVALQAQVFGVEALLRGGQSGAAANAARAFLALAAEDCQPYEMYWPEVMWIGYRALREVQDHHAANALLLQAIKWVQERALPNVPAPLHDAFLHRNPVNRAIFAAASRL